MLGRRGKMTREESRAVQVLGAVHVARLVGLYMVLPVLSPHAGSLAGATSLLIGLSLGIYGATQALFQIPFGALSDRIGRRPAIAVGLGLFAIGSFLSAVTTDARLLVAARALQGSGAVSSVVIAMVADVTREEVRTQAMARLGIWIGGAFAFALLIGPPLASLIGVPAIFAITGGGALVSLGLLLFVLEEAPAAPGRDRLRAAAMKTVLRQRPLLLIDVGVFLLHTVLTVLFVVLPFELERIVGPDNTWKVLVPVLTIGVGVLFWSGRTADRRGWTERFFFIGAALLCVCCLVFALIGRRSGAVVGGIVLFVVAIALLEPTLTSLVSRFARGPHRGTAFGVYSMAQFSGAFFGGVLGGAFLKTERYVLFLGLFVATFLWALALTRIGRLRPRSSEDRSIPRGDRPDPDRPPEPPEGGHEGTETVREPDP
ncbi:MAG: MFS transporter [Candidatus Eisenbacteria bacterium]|nr:MFS transporter [Candidatus Latescibacterota bacterium]MBD3302825.1 MFS transporter [Candidatus Eisenbacteria bacterium]